MTADFTLLADEVDRVVRTVAARGMTVTALHNHMVAETPRPFYLHVWATGSASDIAEGVSAALREIGVPPTR